MVAAMSPRALPTPSQNKFTAYAAASAAALGAAAAAEAQVSGFTDIYSFPATSASGVTAATNTYGAWTATLAQSGGVGNANYNISGPSLGTLSVTLNMATFDAPNGNEFLTFTSTAGSSGTVAFSASFLAGTALNMPSFYYSGDGMSWTPVGVLVSGSTPISFSVTEGSTFGFRLSINSPYVSASTDYLTATISNFSAPASAIPEASTTTLLAGCAALGFVGLMGARRSRKSA